MKKKCDWMMQKQAAELEDYALVLLAIKTKILSKQTL